MPEIITIITLPGRLKRKSMGEGPREFSKRQTLVYRRVVTSEIRRDLCRGKDVYETLRGKREFISRTTTLPPPPRIFFFLAALARPILATHLNNYSTVILQVRRT